jgi:hypothetical protein
MRAIAILGVLGSIAVARPALAEPQANAAPETDKQSQKRHHKKARPAAPRVPARAGASPGSMAEAAASAAAASANRGRPAAEARPLDLTPGRQLAPPDRRGRERTSAIGLGDDGDWKVQAAEVGAMAGIFATLVALCGNGGCLLPDLLGDGGRDDIGPPPDLEIREQPAPRGRR